jgi:ribonuclease T1
VRVLFGFLLVALSSGALGFSESVERKQLPREAIETIALIEKGGPFPYSRDGATFSNREGRLPRRERGWYREYTVKTPGAKDRGARRIVAGRDGTLYYSDDHYRSFRRILE